MDITQLSQLPLTVLVILGAYWVIQRINDEHAKQVVAITAGFLAKYEDIIKRADEDREESRQRWLERDRLLITTLIDNQRAMVENAKENHNLRTTLQPLVTWWQIERRRASILRPPEADAGTGRSATRSEGETDATS